MPKRSACFLGLAFFLSNFSWAGAQPPASNSPSFPFDHAESIFEELRDVGSDAAAIQPRRLPLLDYSRTRVQHGSEPDEQEADVAKFWFSWTEPTGALREGIFRLYLSARSGRPFILVFPISGDPNNFEISRGICRHFFEQGFRCAFYERRLPKISEFSSDLDQIFRLNGFPPKTVETARRGLDALEDAGILRPGEKIGIAGVSLGAIEGSLLALTDPRAKAAALILGGGNLAEILTDVHGAGAKKFEVVRENLLKANHWTLQDFHAELEKRAYVADPLEYIRAIPPDQRLAPERFLMINMSGDTVISNESSDQLYQALAHDGSHPSREMLHIYTFGLLADYKHVLTKFRMGYIKDRMTEHFNKYLSAP